jgi:hypothetical protein
MRIEADDLERWEAAIRSALTTKSHPDDLTFEDLKQAGLTEEEAELCFEVLTALDPSPEKEKAIRQWLKELAALVS